MVQGGVGTQPSGGAAGVADAPRPRGLERLGRFSARRRWWVLGTGCSIAVALGCLARPPRASRSATSSRSRAPTRRPRSTSSTSGSRRRTCRPRRSCSTTSKAAVPTATVNAAVARRSRSCRRSRASRAAGLGQRQDRPADRHLRRRERRHLARHDRSTRSRDRRGASAGHHRGVRRPGHRLRPAADRAAEPRGRDRAARGRHHPDLRVRHGRRRVPPAHRCAHRRHDRHVDPHDHRDRGHGRHRRADPRLDDRSRRRHRLLAAHRQPVPPGARRGHRGARRDRAAIGTAGSASLFAGMCVAIALCGLWFAGVPYVSTLGFSAAMFVAVMVLAALTLLPALLGILGPHIDRLRVMPKPKQVKAEGTGFWYRWGHEVARARLVVRGGQPGRAPAARRAGAEHAARVHDRRRRADRHDPARGLRPRDPGLRRRPERPTAPHGGAPERHGRRTTSADITAAEKLLAAIKATKGIASVTPPLPNPAGNAAVALATPTSAPNAADHPGAGPHVARRGHPDRDEGHTARRPGPRRRRHRRADRPDRPHELAVGAGHRRGGARRVHPADDGVPLDPRAAQGRGHEPAVDRRRVRRDRRGLPVGLGQEPDRAERRRSRSSRSCP